MNSVSIPCLAHDTAVLTSAHSALFRIAHRCQTAAHMRMHSHVPFAHSDTRTDLMGAQRDANCDIAVNQPDLWPTVGPYLPQLHSLTINGIRRNHWASECLQPQYTTHTLTHLHIPSQLCRHLAGLLASYAPALTTLAVARFAPARVPRRKYRAVHWSVRTLQLTDPLITSATALKWLPLPKDGKMVIEMCGPMVIELPLQDLVSARACASTHLIIMCKRVLP